MSSSTVLFCETLFAIRTHKLHF